MSDDTLDICANDKKRTVLRSDYVRTFLRGIRESYPSVTEEEVNTQLDLLTSGEKWTTVIGAFIEGDLWKA